MRSYGSASRAGRCGWGGGSIYVGFADIENADEPFKEKMARLTAQLETQFTESARLEAAIRENLTRLATER